MRRSLGILIVQCLLCVVKGKVPKRPHVILILADDLGWNDVSWHNRKILTPRMEEISADGVRLQKSYVSPKCSPSRAALMTGRYPWRLGMQRGAIERYQATGLNTSIQILPEYLKSAGYSTHMVGKWHLGFCNEAYLPTRRGFDTFFGQYSHVTGYYNRNIDAVMYKPEQKGHDLRDGDKVSFEGSGMFSTELYSRKAVQVIKNHDPSQPLFLYLAYQAPHGPVTTAPKQFSRKYAGRSLGSHSLKMASTITAMDSGIGSVFDALKKYGLYENSVFIFSTDNGGAVKGSSNLPLKGKKEQLYEGGIRGVGFVNSPFIQQKGVSTRLMYISDWFATIMHMAGLKNQIPSDVDSYNVWHSISRRKKSPRNEILLSIDQDNLWGTWAAGLISNSWKLVWGQSFLLKQKLESESCNYELYNIKKDPNEKENLAKGGKMKKKVKEMKDRIMSEFGRMAPADYPPETSRGWPVHFGGNLSPGWCEAKI